MCTIKSVNSTLQCMYHHFLCEIHLRRHQSNSMYFHTTVFVIVLWCIVNKRTANKTDHCIRHCVMVYCEQTYSQQKGPLYSSLCCSVLWTIAQPTKRTTAFVIALWCIVNKRTANKRDHCIRHCVVVYCEQTFNQQKGPLHSSLSCGVLWTIVQPAKGTTVFVIALWCILNKRIANKRKKSNNTYGYTPSLFVLFPSRGIVQTYLLTVTEQSITIFL